MGLLPDPEELRRKHELQTSAEVAWLDWSIRELAFEVDAMRVGALASVQPDAKSVDSAADIANP